MAGLAGFREQYPQYADVPDAELADSLHSKFYSDIPKDQYLESLGMGKPSLMSRAGAALKPVEREPMPSAADTINAGWTSPPEETLSVPGSVLDQVPVAKMPATDSAAIDNLGVPVTPEFMNRVRRQMDAAAPERRAVLASRPDMFGRAATEILRQQQSIDQTASSGEALTGKTAAVRALDTRKEARSAALASQGLDPQFTQGIAQIDAAAGADATIGGVDTSNFDFETAAAYKDANPIVKGAAAGVTELGKQGVAIHTLINEALGRDEMAGKGRAAWDALGRKSEAINNDSSIDVTTRKGSAGKYLGESLGHAVTSVITNAPGLALSFATGGGGAGLMLMAGQVGADEVLNGRKRGLSNEEALARGVIYGWAEAVGEKFGLDSFKAFWKEAAKGVKTSDLPRFLAEHLKKEIPGELLTTNIQYGTDVGYGLEKPSLERYLRQNVDTVVQTLMQGGMMSAGGVVLQKSANAIRPEQDLTAGVQFNPDAIDAYARQQLDPANAQMRQVGARAAPVQPPASPRAELAAVLSGNQPVAEILAAQAPAAPQTTPQAPLQPAAFGWPDIKTPAVATLPDGQIITGQIAGIQDSDGQPMARFVGADGQVWMIQPGEADIKPAPAAAKRQRKSAFVSSQQFSVDTEDNGKFDVTVHRTASGDVVVNHPDGLMEYKAAFANGKTDAELLAYGFEPVGFRNAAQAPAGNGTRTAPVQAETAEHVKIAEQAVNTEPSEAQKEAGNYQLGHLAIQGLDIAIENPAGSVRSGVDKAGKPWSNVLRNTYGYLKGATASDGDKLDAFIGPDPQSQQVFVIDQIDPDTGRYDEAKTMLGFNSLDEARAAYLSNYDAGWKGVGAITPLSMPAFKAWIAKGATHKPLAYDQKAAIAERKAAADTQKAGEAYAAEREKAVAAIGENQVSAIEDQVADQNAGQPTIELYRAITAALKAEATRQATKPAAPAQTPTAPSSMAQPEPVAAAPTPKQLEMKARAAKNIDAYLNQNAAGRWQLSQPIDDSDLRSRVIDEMDRRNQGELNAAQAAEAPLPVVQEEARPGPALPEQVAQFPAVREQLSVEFGGQRYPVESLQDASEKWEQFRDQSEGGVSDIGNGVPIFDQTGKQVAYVSYNGKVWQGAEYDAKAEPVYSPKGQDSAEVGAGGTAISAKAVEVSRLMGELEAISGPPAWPSDRVQKLIDEKGEVAADKTISALKLAIEKAKKNQKFIEKYSAAKAKQNPEASRPTPVAESQAPAPSEPGDGGVAPTQDKALQATEIPALTKEAAHRLARKLNDDTVAAPHPTKPGMWALMSQEEADAQKQGAEAGADFLASNRAEFRHEGFRIYPISIKGEPRWAVQSLDNSEKEKKGERQIGGDAIVDTPDQAKKQAENQVTERSQKAEDRRQFAEQDAAEEAKKEANRGLSITQRRANAALDKPTNLPVNAGVGRGTRREAMESAVSQERAITAVDVRDTAAYKRDEDEQGRLHRAGYGAFFGNDSHPQKMRFNELSAKLKNRDNYQKKEYRLYMGRDTDGSFYDITKTEYDYAQTLIATKKAEASTPAPSTPTAKKEPWQYGELEYGDKYIDEVVLPQLRKDLENAHGGKFQEYKSKAAAVRGLKERIDTLENHRDAKARKYYASLDDHYAAVRRALAAGKDVPAVAYESYDDLKADVSAGRIKGDGQEVARVEQPQHIEAGQTEPATAPVIAASIKESAKNTPMNIEQAREWLLKQIDAAMIDAKSAAEEDVWDRAEGKVDLKGRMDVKETIGYKVFDVPGDGRFSVLNLKESLQKFKKQVAATPGFKKNATRPMSVANGGGGKTSVRDMLEDGEFVLAVDYGRLIGEPLLFGAVRKGEAHPIAYTNAEPVDIKGIEAQVGREWNVTGKSFSWRVIETTTGVSVSSETTKERAVSKAKAYVDEHGTDKLIAQIKETPKVSQSELERQFTDWGSEEEAKAQKTRDAVERADTEDRALWNSIFPLKDGEKRSPNPWNDIDHMQAVVLAKDAAKAGKGDEFVSLIERRRGGTNNMLALAARKALAEAGKQSGGTDYKGFERTPTGNGSFTLKDGNLLVKVEAMGGGKFQASHGSAKSSPHINSEQGAVDWAANLRDASKKITAYPFYSNNKLFNAEGTAELPKDWTGVARSDSGKRFFYLGQENGERSFNPLKAESYEDALKEAEGMKNDKPVIPEGYREVDQSYFGGSVLKPIYAPFAVGDRVKFVGGLSGVIDGFIGGPVTTGALIKYDNGLTGRAEWRDVEAVKKPAAEQEPKNFKSIDALNAANNPLGEDDWIRFSDGSEWQVKGRMNGWVLMQGKTEHPTVRNIMGQVQLIRAVIEANDAAQKPKEAAFDVDAEGGHSWNVIKAHSEWVRLAKNQWHYRFAGMGQGVVIDTHAEEGRSGENKWRTSDGELHVGLAEAKAHEIETHAKPKLIENGYLNEAAQPKPKTIAEASLGDLLRAAADKADGKAAPEAGKPADTKKKADPLAPIREFFTPGNIILSDYWKTHDKVLEFREGEQGAGSWDVNVVQVKKDGDQWVETEQSRWHATAPGKSKVVDRVATKEPAQGAEKVGDHKIGGYPVSGLGDKALKTVIEKSSNEADKAAASAELERRKVGAGETANKPDTGIAFNSIESPRKTKAQDETLIIQHNLSAANLLHAVRMGGIPVPSLAITEKDAPLDGFGEITLLGSSAMADPKGYAGAKVFGADIYSPRYPSVTYKLDNKAIKKLNAELAPFQKGGRGIYGGEIGKIEDLTQNDAFRAYMLDKTGKTDIWDLRSGDMEAEASRMLADAGAEEKLFRGYDYNGNRKYQPHTLENVVKILKKELRGGEGFNYGVGSIRSAFTPQFRSIKQIREAKGRLMNKTGFESVKSEIDDEFSAVSDKLAPYHSHANEFGFGDIVSAMMYDSAKMGVPRSLKENMFIDVPAEVQQDVAAFLSKLRTLPTAYFEAKILRDVDLAEFSGAVVPEGVDPKVLEALKTRGITDIRTYKKGDDGARAKAVTSLAEELHAAGKGTLFSLEDDRKSAVTRAIDRAIAQESEQPTETQRGAGWLKIKLRQAQHKGDLSAKAVEMVEWLVKQNPALVKYLAVAVENPKALAEGFNAVEPAPTFKAVDTESAEFKRWFGDSNVVDADGKPLRVYHGTRGDFAEFDHDMNERLPGFWFTPDPSAASSYAAGGLVNATAPILGANVMPVYVALKNPKTYVVGKEPYGDAWNDYMTGDYDGFIMVADGQFKAVVAKEDTQIKSAISNTGAFDPSNPDIRQSIDRPTGAAGNYNPFTQVMTLFRGNASDTTAVHEILHHLERMMPAEMQAEIRKEWLRAVTAELAKAQKAGDQKRIDYFTAVLAGDQKKATELLTGKGVDGFNDTGNAWFESQVRSDPTARRLPPDVVAKRAAEIRAHWEKQANSKSEKNANEAKTALAMNDYRAAIQRAHTHKNLTFIPLPAGAFSAKGTRLVHQSPGYGKKQGSSYRLVIVNGEPAYAREADHWGKFHTQEWRDGEQVATDYNWTLDGVPGKNDGERRAGYILLRDLPGGSVGFNAVEPAPTFKAVDTALTIGEIPNTGKGFAEDTRVYLTEVIPESFKLYRSVWVGENESPRLDSPGAYWAETPEGARRSGFPPEQGKRRQILLEIVATRDSIDVAQSIARRRQYGEPEIVLNKLPETASAVDAEEKVGGTANRDQMLQRVESAIAEIESRAIEASGHAWKTLSQDKATKALLNETRSAIVSAQTKQLNLDAEANYASIEGAPSLTDVLDALARATNTAIDAIRAEVFGPRLIENAGAFDPTNPDIRYDLAIGQDYQYLNPSEFWAVRMTSTMAARFEAKSIWARSLQWLREALEHIKGALGLKSDHPLLKALDDLIARGTGEFQSKEMLGSSEVYANIEESGPEEVAGVVMRDASLAARLLLHPRQIAANHKPFVPVFDTAIKQFEERDRIVSGLGEMAKPYFELTHAQRLNVNKIVEQGRLDRTVYTVADLENGIHHAESGDLVTLDAEEIGAYKALRKTFNEALSLFRDTMLEEFGFAELIPEQKAAAKLRQMIADGEIEESRTEWARHVAKAIDEIEQAKRTGYAPFNRYGQFVVAVKALPAGVEVQDDDGKQLVTGIPEYGDDPLTQIVTDMGGQYDVFRDGWVIDDTRKAVLRALETTLFATKVEVNAFNEWRKQGKDVTAIPEVKAAFDEAKRKYGKAPNARVLAFHITEKAKADDANLSTFDELARISDVDVETWDAVREKLQEAIKAKSFRKHFFGSDNTPGYSVDFERSVADYIIGMSGYLARRKHVKDFDNAIKRIKAPALAKYAEDYRKYINSPADEFALLKNIGFLYYIAGSTATAVANLTQVPMLTMPTLVQFVPHHIAAREVARAWGETLAMFSPTKTGLQMFDPAKVPADVRDVFKAAWEDQLFVPLETLDLMAASSIKTVGGRKTMRALSVTTQAIAYEFMFAERLNRITTFIAAQRISRMKVAKDRMRDVVKNDAWARHSIGGRAWGERNFAEWVVDESQYRMGKVNRPTVMRGVGSPLLQFKGYMIQTLEAGYRMAVMHGKGGKPAALAALAMMLMLGGIWGLPGLEDLREMIERLYKVNTGKDLDLKTEMRQLIARETGSAALAAATNKGIPYATIGVDMSRVGMGNILPDSALQVGGIPVDLAIARPMRAAEKMAAGKTTEAMSEFLPNFLKNPAMGLQWKRDGLRDKYGSRMMTPGEFDYGDVAIKSLGWTPTKVTNRREYTYAESRAERGIDELKRRYTNDLVRAYVHEAEAKDPAERAEYKADQAKILAKIEEHNKTASPENLIKLDPGTLRRKAAAEFSGSAAREGKERKLSRGAAQDRRELFQLNR